MNSFLFQTLPINSIPGSLLLMLAGVHQTTTKWHKQFLRASYNSSVGEHLLSLTRCQWVATTPPHPPSPPEIILSSSILVGGREVLRLSGFALSPKAFKAFQAFSVCLRSYHIKA